jgi:hypothetical protein
LSNYKDLSEVKIKVFIAHYVTAKDGPQAMQPPALTRRNETK